jgi:hypothetical protein
MNELVQQEREADRANVPSVDTQSPNAGRGLQRLARQHNLPKKDSHFFPADYAYRDEGDFRRLSPVQGAVGRQAAAERRWNWRPRTGRQFP